MQAYCFRSGKDAYIISGQLVQTPHGFCGAPVERLCRLEEMAQALQSEQQALSQQMEALRQEGKTKSYHFKEKMGRKLAGCAGAG